MVAFQREGCRRICLGKLSLQFFLLSEVSIRDDRGHGRLPRGLSAEDALRRANRDAGGRRRVHGKQREQRIKKWCVLLTRILGVPVICAGVKYLSRENQYPFHENLRELVERDK
jgi:hypothetical protein